MQPAQPLESKTVPFDPTLPYTRSSLPPTFLLALLAALIGIPLYLALNGAFSGTSDKLEDGIKSQELDDEDLLQDDDEDSELTRGIRRKKRKADLDDPEAGLEFDDLKSLGGMVGLAALIVLGLAVFPEEVEKVVSSFTPGNQIASFVGMLGGNSQPEPRAVGRREETYTEKTVRTGDGRSSGFKEHTVKEGQVPPIHPTSDEPVAGISGGAQIPDLLGGRSMIDLMILCKMDPDICTDLGLPFGPKASLPAVEQPAQTPQSETLEEIMQVLPSDSHLSVLRSHPLLLIDPSERTLGSSGWFLLSLSIFPIIYAFGEFSFQAGKKQETAKMNDKRRAIETQAIKDLHAYENSENVYRSRAEVMKRERREIEAIAESSHPTRPWRDAMKDRPWWAGKEWVAPEKPTHEEQGRGDRKVPKGLQPAAEKYFLDEEGKGKKDYGTRHFKLGWNAEELERKAERYEADKARLAARWGDGKTFKGPYKGFFPIFEELDSKGRDAPKSNRAILEALSAPRVTAKMASSKASELRKFREEGKTDRKTKKQIMPKMSDTWEREAKEEAAKRAVVLDDFWNVNQRTEQETARNTAENERKQAVFMTYQAERDDKAAQQKALDEANATRHGAAAANPQVKDRFWKRK